MADRPLPQLPPLPDEETRTLEQALPPPDPPPEAPPRRRARPDGDDGPPRKLASAGHALVVCVLALAIGLVLNAPGAHKNAYNKPAGWERDVALALTGPLAGVSHALLLDRPRKGVQSAVGRSGNDDISTDLGLPPTTVVTTNPATTTPRATTKQPGPTTPAPSRKPAFSPKKKLRIWIAGDSLVIVPGESLLRAVAGNRAVAAEPVDGRIASGLERPDVFNWFTHIREVMEEDKPRAVVLMFGGNDDHGFMTGIPEGREVGTFGSPTWRAEYRRRVASVMDTVTRDGGHLIWIGLPITRDSDQTLRFDVINSILQTEAAKRKGRVTYLDTYFFFAGDDGGYAQYIEDPTGKLVKMRADDGVHFERPAGDLIAAKLLERLEEAYDFTSWRGRS